MTRPPPISPPFPYTTLSGSGIARGPRRGRRPLPCPRAADKPAGPSESDRKSTSLNSSHIPLFRIPSFFFNDPAPPDISPLPLHDALRIGDGTRPASWPTAVALSPCCG